MNCFEFGDRLSVRRLVPFRRAISLADVDNEERDIEPSLFHFGECHLSPGLRAARIVFLRCEVSRDIVMSVYRNDALMDVSCCGQDVCIACRRSYSLCRCCNKEDERKCGGYSETETYHRNAPGLEYVVKNGAENVGKGGNKSNACC